MSDEVLDDVMIKGSCKGKADAIVNCQCNIESAPADASRQKDVCSILIISAASSGRGLHS